MKNIKNQTFLICIIIIALFIGGCISKPIEKLNVNDLGTKGEIKENVTNKNGIINETNNTSQVKNKFINWTKEKKVITQGVSSSIIIKDNKYLMYYTGNGIELAVSEDGLNFIKKGRIIENGPVDSEQEMVTNPTVFQLLDKSYRMIYEGSLWAEDERDHRYQMDRKLYSAISSDGEKWFKEEGVRFWDYGDGKPGEVFTSVPDIIRLPDNRLRMYYTRGATSAIALSNDEGLTWTKEVDLKLRKVAIDLDILLLDDNMYKLFFTTFEDEFGFGEQWMMSADSIDGINFVINENKIIESSTLGGLITDPDVIKTDKGYRMYYGEFKNGKFESDIMSAFASE